MKILHINSYYSTSGFYKNLYDKQIEEGYDIDVFVPVSTNQNSINIDLGTYTTLKVNHGKYDRFVFYYKHNKIYKDIISTHSISNYSITHAHSLFSNGFISMKLKLQFGTPYIVAVRNTDVNIFFKYFFHLRKLGVKILNQAEKVIFLSKSYRDFVINNYIPLENREEFLTKCEIIPNGIDRYWIENKGVLKKISEETLKIIYVGVIDKNKNILTTIKALNILRKKGINIVFTVVGRIVDKSIYEQIKEIPYLNYLGQKTKEELINIYRDNDIFIMPSITETFGLVYAEAMSQGLPVIYSKGQGFDDQFKEGEVGFHVDCFNPNEIVNRIYDIISTYELISERCLDNSSEFDWNTINLEYKRIYNKCSLNEFRTEKLI
ncbi:glycosyltransferase family 4 protein [Paenibacillus sp. BC26]|uniref:glycosyltransferase family 4 protein n=1 Tax=Paenibacillus sp. BC26 TaxID=1881032 RepID=UPI0008F23A94|nr:glycosyltransferase family 4 protein [Paenibacillus sp. BC26]SFT25334.1 Glycosyltransferase involved in cell wall bisynthesis [Paenibacillus sp. BC26]